MMTRQDGTIRRVHRTTLTSNLTRKLSNPEGDASDLRFASPSTLLATAAGVVEDISSKSNVFDYELEARVPKFSPAEILAGRVLGRGGFCVCQEIEKIKPLNLIKGESSQSLTKTPRKEFFLFRIIRRGDTADSDDEISCEGQGLENGYLSKSTALKDDQKLSRQNVIKQAKATRTGRKCCYVVKKVNQEMAKITYIKGNVDIALEAKFLSSLCHRNIIELVAVSSADPCTKSYFLVLERLEETLNTRLKSWMDRERMCRGIMSCFGGAKKVEQLYIDRMEVSYDIASALQYLHSRNIAYRDLKPANIGFASDKVLKLFDFGLAKELHDLDKSKDGTYRNMTALTGAIRYMAPEVGIGKPYNLSADIYSWSMLMWFILALEPPFGLYTENMIMDRAWMKGYRPVIFKRWNDNVKDLIGSAWDQNPSQRPSFLQVTLALKKELVNYDDSKHSKSTNTSVASD